MTETIKPAEMRLLRRLRTLPSGANLCIIEIDAGGVYTISVIGSGKLEKIRRFTDNLDSQDKSPANPQEHL